MFTYASLPGVKPTPILWKMCCDPDCDAGGEHVTYRILTDSDKTLRSIIDDYVQSNVVGLIIINSTNSTFLSDEFITRYVPPTPPVYILSSEDGERLRQFVKTHEEGSIQIKASVESAVDSALPTSVVSAQPVHSTMSSKPVYCICICLFVCVFICV